jgi:hypothetical protein
VIFENGSCAQNDLLGPVERLGDPHAVACQVGHVPFPAASYAVVGPPRPPATF